MYTHMNALLAHNQCFLWPKQLVFVVKRLIRKKTPLSWLSQALTKGQQQLDSDKLLCFCVQILISISAFHQKASVKWPWLIYSIVKLCASKEDSNFLFKCMKCFYVDCAKGSKWLAKKLKFKGGLHVLVGPHLRSSFSSFKGAYGVPGDWCFKMFDVKVPKGGVGGGIILSTKFYLMNPTEICRPTTWWQNNGVSDLWLAINNSCFQAPILQTGVLRVRPHTDTSPAVYFQQLSEFPFQLLAKG